MIFEFPVGPYQAGCVSMYVGVPYEEHREDTLQQGSLNVVPMDSANPSAGPTQTLEILQGLEDGLRST